MSKSRGLWLWAPWALFIAAVAGWTAYWHLLAAGAQARLESVIAAQRAAGAEASIGHITRRGFPVLLKFALDDVAYASSRGGWRATTPRLAMHVDLLNPQHVIFEALAPIRVERNGGAVTEVSADRALASIRTSGDRLAVAGVEADSLRLDDPAQDGVLTAVKLVANVREDPRAAGDYQLALTLQSLQLPRDVRSFETFGRDVALLRAAVVVNNGAALLQPAPNDPLGVWRDGGGRLRFDALAVQWGPLDMTGSGEGGLDAQRRLEGRIEAPIERPAPVIAAIAGGPDIDDDTRRGLSLLAAGFALTGRDVRLTVEAHDGVLRLEGLPVRMLPPVY